MCMSISGVDQERPHDSGGNRIAFERYIGGEVGKRQGELKNKATKVVGLRHKWELHSWA